MIQHARYSSRFLAVVTSFAVVLALSLIGLAAHAQQAPAGGGDSPQANPGEPQKVIRSDAEWRQILTPAQYFVTRQKGTEPAFSGRYARGHFKGVFTCVGCGSDLFSSTHKFDSGTGWPSFYRPIRNGVVDSDWDYSQAEARMEVMCATCGAHLGHVFNDGPRPTGMRFCINSVALKLKPFTAASTTTRKADPKAKSKTKPGDKPAEDADTEATPDESDKQTNDAAPKAKSAAPRPKS